MILFLVGYMGSGKSEIGKSLAEELNFNFIDFDCYIENRIGLSIAQIFETKGEIFFRKQEQLCLQDVLNLEKTVVSFGGGTPCYGNNINDMISTPNSMLIYLKASVETLTVRLKSELSSRPLISHLKNETELNDFIRKHLFERNYYYEQASVKVIVDEKSVAQITTEILELLH